MKNLAMILVGWLVLSLPLHSWRASAAKRLGERVHGRGEWSGWRIGPVAIVFDALEVVDE